MRLVDETGALVPFQVDEKDRQDRYLVSGGGNGLIEPDDELVFQLSLAPHETRTVHLYAAIHESVPPPPRFACTLELEQRTESDRPYDLAAGHDAVRLGVRGGHGGTRYHGRGAGSLTSLSVRGRELIPIGHAYGNIGFVSALTDQAWGDVTVLAAGPVRAVLGVRLPEATLPGAEPDETVAVYRYYMVYDRIGYAEIAECVVRADAAQETPITYGVRLCPGGSRRDWVHERLLLPDADGGVTVLEAHARAGKTGQTAPLWTGAVNPATGTGLLWFAARDVQGQAEVRFCPDPAKLDETLRSSAWGAMHTAAVMQLCAPLAAGTQWRRFGLLALDTADPASVMQLLGRFRQQPLRRAVAVGPTELAPVAATQTE